MTDEFKRSFMVVLISSWNNRRSAAILTMLLCLYLCPDSGGAILLHDVTKDTGITFVHTDGSTGQFYIMETVSAGLALFDYDGDSDVDIYFLNGAVLGKAKVEKKPRNALFRNDGNWKFTDVTDLAGVGDTGFGLGVAVGDYDNDGNLDIYVNNYGPNVMYRNNGDGTFTDVTAQTGVSCGNKVGAATHFLDMDKDADLDLFVANYVDFTYERHKIDSVSGIYRYAGPLDYPPTTNNLYRNNGDGTFTDVSVESGIAEHKGWGMGGICADYDNDGDTDIRVLNDVYADFLFQNDGTGKFQEVALMTGLAYNIHGDQLGSMAVDCVDYDHDGWMDFLQTSYNKEMAILYRSIEGRMFEDVGITSGIGAATLAPVTWGAGFVDFDNDGDHDIFVACGHLEDTIELYDTSETYFQENLLFTNNGEGKFENVSKTGGDGMKVKLSSRGAGFDDMDEDGDIDVVILNSRREPTILRNDSKNSNHWIQIRLRGVKTNRNGVGARVKVIAGKLAQMAEVHSGRSYQSHYGMRLHFGLADKKKVDRIEVHWVGAEVDVLENVPADQRLLITEGSSK